MSTVDHPTHYNSAECRCLGCSRPIECIDVIEGFSLNVGNAIKYLWRAGKKTEDPTEDFEKAIWYIRREISRRSAPATEPAELAALAAATKTDDEVVHVVAAAIVQNGFVLLSQRKRDVDFGGSWECPGGKVEKSETHGEALVRELREELGIEVRPNGCVALWYGQFKKNKVSRPDRQHIYYFLYAVEAFEGTPKGREGQEVAWFNPGDLDRLTVAPALEECREVVKKLLVR